MPLLLLAHPRISFGQICPGDLTRMLSKKLALPSYYDAVGGETIIPTLSSQTSTRRRISFKSVLWKSTFVFGTLIYGSHTIFINLSQVDGQIPFNPTSAVFMTETLKLLICLFIFAVNLRLSRQPFVAPKVQQAWPYAVPALIYAINNNLAYYIQLHMDPASFQILSNMKIASTAVLYRVVMKKKIGTIQSFALFLLILAGVCNSIGGSISKRNSDLDAEDAGVLDGELDAGTLHVSFVGLVLILLYSLLSGMAGVYTEYILKQSNELPLSLQNILLYVFGVGINGGSYFVQALSFEHENAGTMDINATHLFSGYSYLTWIMILTQAINGLIMSIIFKHSDNIARLFLVSSSMVVTTLVSVLLFHLSLNMYFYSAFLLVVCALYLYQRR